MIRHNSNAQYIWQRSDWPNFTWRNDEIIDSLSRLSNLHGQLLGKMSMLGFDSKSRSMLHALTDELIGSSEIEGVTLYPESVRSSIARRLGIGYDGLHTEDHYVEGLVDVMFDAVNNCHTPLSADRLFGWHAALFPLGRSGMHRITVADWRQGDEPMQVISGAMGRERIHYEAPSSTAVPNEMRAFIDWCNSARHSPFILAAIAHLWFVTIHPFDDGNGRIARTLADLFLARLNEDNAQYYSMSAEINRRKMEYYDILERTQKGSLDITQWLSWFMKCLEGAITRSLSTIETTLAKTDYWDRFSEIAVNERQRKVINRLWDGFEGKLSTSKWAKICHCSQDTALRDINYLVANGMLTPSPDSGRSTHYLLP